MAVDYLTICGVGLIFTFGYNMVSSVLRGMGDSKHPFLFITIASAVNLVLDLLFTGYLGWGVAGAAAATILGQAVSFLFSLVFLYRRRASFFFDFRPASWRIRGSYLANGAVTVYYPSITDCYSSDYANYYSDNTCIGIRCV